MNDLARGALAGLAGTAAMSAVMAAMKATGGLRGDPPPRPITARAEAAVGVLDHLSGPAFEASWVASHVAYGAAAGAVYSALPGRRVTPWVGGPVFGVGLWAVSYAGWLPAAGLYPPPDREPEGRVAGIVAAHVVFGTTVALVDHALGGGRGD